MHFSTSLHGGTYFSWSIIETFIIWGMHTLDLFEEWNYTAGERISLWAWNSLSFVSLDVNLHNKLL
jgi:hypothetical protein